ncbi:DUF6336 family protein [Streptomyces sp. NPDC052023]|uniref:DUF6336 family protein n=1 Tax=Streptomyces sp. NPDC052023 TaxID=3365681 RepID=UPI0037D78405
MTLDDDGVITPRLRPADVVRRGALFGLAGAATLAVLVVCIAEHNDRTEFLSVLGVLSLFFGAGFFVIGSVFWLFSRRDVRRLRDWRSMTGQSDAITASGPMFVRLGVFLLVLGSAGLGMAQLVDAAPYDSWLHSH